MIAILMRKPPLGLTLLLALPCAITHAQTSEELKALVAHLKFVIPDETAQVGPSTLERSVAKYQKRAVAAGLNDIDRQTACVLLALYTSGKGLEQPGFKQVMAHPPASPDEFSDALIGLPQRVYDLWISINNLNEISFQNAHGLFCAPHVRCSATASQWMWRGAGTYGGDGYAGLQPYRPWN